MKILLVSSGSGSRGGGEIFLVYLAQGLADRGHEVVVWMPSHPRMDELAQKCSRVARMIRADYRNTYGYAARSLATRFNRTTSRRIAREWKGLQPDVIHLNKQNLEDGLDLLRATSDCGVPSVCTIHLTQNAVYLGAKVARLRNWIARNALCKHKGVLVAVQEARRAELDGFLGTCARTRTVLNGVPIPDLERVQDLRVQKRRELGLKDDNLLVLGLGRLVEQKRPDLFLTAARELHRQFPTTKFLWLGDGKFSPNWDEQVVREKLGGIVSRTDWNSEVLPLLSAADLLLRDDYRFFSTATRAKGGRSRFSDQIFREVFDRFGDNGPSQSAERDDWAVRRARSRAFSWTVATRFPATGSTLPPSESALCGLASWNARTLGVATQVVEEVALLLCG